MAAKKLEQFISPIAVRLRRTLPVNYKYANARGLDVFYASTKAKHCDDHSEPLNEAVSSNAERVSVPETQESAGECVSVPEKQESDCVLETQECEYECASDVSNDSILLEESQHPSDSPPDMANTTLVDETEISRQIQPENYVSDHSMLKAENHSHIPGAQQSPIQSVSDNTMLLAEIAIENTPPDPEAVIPISRTPHPQPAPRIRATPSTPQHAIPPPPKFPHHCESPKPVHISEMLSTNYRKKWNVYQYQINN